MLLTLLIWSYQILIIMPFGLTFLSFRPLAMKDRSEGISYFCIAFLIGLALVTSLASFFSLFIKIGLWVNLAFLVLAGIQWFILIRSRNIPHISIDRKPRRGMMVVLILFMIIAFSSVLLSAEKIPSNPDTGIYHAQAIRWIETYRAVPGLGNLHERLAYNSSWLVACALFSLSFLKGQSFHLLPSLLFLVAVIYFFDGVMTLSLGKFKLSIMMKVIFIGASFFFLLGEISSPGTDLPVTLILWVVTTEWVRMLEKGRAREIRQEIGLGLIAAFVLTIKFSSLAVFVLLIWVFIRLARLGNFSDLGLFSMASISVILPFLLRNLILSGYLVFPGLTLDPFHFDWAFPLQKVREESAVIHWFALLPHIDRFDFEKMSLMEQYKRWFFNQLPRHKAMLVVMSCIPFFIACLLPLRQFRKRLVDELPVLAGPVIMLVLGTLFWLVTAPAFRFGYGFILSFLTLAGSFFLLFLVELLHLPKSLFIWTVLLVALALVIQIGMASFRGDEVSNIWLLPEDYPSWHTEMCQFGNFSLQCATQYASCWYDPFPCAIVGNDKVFMRGADFSQGFKSLP